MSMPLGSEELALHLALMHEARAREISENHIPNFIRESNKIEGEVTGSGVGRIYPSDRKAISWLKKKKLKSTSDLCTLHAIVGERINASWVGNIRKVDVNLVKRDLNGNTSYISTIPKSQVHKYIDAYMKCLPKMTSWEAHTLFELIHPFNDLNGRVGRLLWLYKKDMLIPSIGFLHSYYYETLDSVRKKRSKGIDPILLDLLNN